MSLSPVLELSTEDHCLELMLAMDEDVTDEVRAPPSPVTLKVQLVRKIAPSTSADRAPRLVPAVWIEELNPPAASDSAPYVPPAEIPLFLPVKKGLCWRCGSEGHHRDNCTRPPILFCSRCGHRDRLTKNCPCMPWLPEEGKTVLPAPERYATARAVSISWDAVFPPTRPFPDRESRVGIVTGVGEWAVQCLVAAFVNAVFVCLFFSRIVCGN